MVRVDAKETDIWHLRLCQLPNRICTSPMAIVRQAVASTSQLVRRSAARRPKALCPVCSARPPQNATLYNRAQSTVAGSTDMPTSASSFSANETSRPTPTDAAPPASEDPAVESKNNEGVARLKSASEAPPNSPPSLQDFYALCPDNIRMPSAVDSVDTPEFAVYERRYGEMIASLEKAFNRTQVVNFFKSVRGFRVPVKRMGKREMVKTIVAEHVGFVDPASLRAAEKHRTELAGRDRPKSIQGGLNGSPLHIYTKLAM